MSTVPSNVAQFSFTIDGAEELRVMRFEGTEAISELFRFDLTLASLADDIEFASVVGKPAQLVMSSDNGERHVSGIVSRFAQIGSIGRFTIYQAEVVPKVWLLGYRKKCRIFQEMAVPDIIDKVLTDAGIASSGYRIDVHGDHPARTYCVQYRESDFDFLSRLAEEEGIFFFFEHAEGDHLMVFGDVPSVFVSLPEAQVSYRETSGMTPLDEVIYQYTYSEEVRPGAVMLRDYEFLKPSLSLQKDSQYEKDTQLEVYDYPGEYTSPDVGAGLAKVRLEELQVSRKRGSGQSVCRRFVPGFRFVLEEYPRTTLNQEYLLTRVVHSGTETQSVEEASEIGQTAYTNSFECIPADVPFRPTRLTPRPLVTGSQTAVVVGPGGEEIYTDEHGRVKVQFHWDREGQKDEKSSCWIRVSHSWAGESWGAIRIPRIGQEVIVDFLEGDPDQPIITGRVYNGEQVPPYALPGNKTQSGVKSRSSLGGGADNFNEIRFEDNKGAEQLFIHAEKNQDIEVENDETHWVGHDRKKTIDNDETTEVKHDRTETVGNNETITIKANRTETVEKEETITINGGRTETVAKNETITINGGRSETVAKDESISIDGGRTETVGKDESISIDGGRSETVGKDEGITIGGRRTVTVAKDESLTINGGRTETVAKDERVTISGGRTVSVTKDDMLTVGKRLAITATDSITLTTGDASIIMKKDGTITVKGKDITIDGSGDINIKASKNITIKGQKIAQN